MYNMVNTDVICPQCGEGRMIREEPKVITSNTERYAYLCPNCGFVHTAKSDEDMEEWIKSLDKPIEEEILKEKEINYHAKQDFGKAKLSLVPRRIIWDVATIREYGNNKYPDGGPDNWRSVEPERYRDAAYRHFLSYLDDPKSVDSESGLPHLWHLACNIAFLCEMEDEFLSERTPVTKKIEYPYSTAEPQVVWTNYIPEACRSCSNHPANGGSGNCNCTLGSPKVTSGVIFTEDDKKLPSSYSTSASTDCAWRDDR